MMVQYQSKSAECGYLRSIVALLSMQIVMVQVSQVPQNGCPFVCISQLLQDLALQVVHQYPREAAAAAAAVATAAGLIRTAADDNLACSNGSRHQDQDQTRIMLPYARHGMAARKQLNALHSSSSQLMRKYVQKMAA